MKKCVCIKRGLHIEINFFVDGVAERKPREYGGFVEGFNCIHLRVTLIAKFCVNIAFVHSLVHLFLTSLPIVTHKLLRPFYSE